MLLTVTDSEGRSASIGAPSFPPSMAGGCSAFRAWFVAPEPGEPTAASFLRAAWLDADGAERSADVAGAEWVERRQGGFAALGDAEFSLSDPSVGYLG